MRASGRRVTAGTRWLRPRRVRRQAGSYGDHGGNPDGGRLVVTVRVLHARCAAALALFLENRQLQTSYKPIRMEIPDTSTVTNLNGTMPPDKKNILIISFSWIVDAGLGL